MSIAASILIAGSGAEKSLAAYDDTESGVEEANEEEEQADEISDSELLDAYFGEHCESWNRDYEFEPWDREVKDSPIELIAPIKRVLADNQCGGTLSKNKRILALNACLKEVEAE